MKVSRYLMVLLVIACSACDGSSESSQDAEGDGMSAAGSEAPVPPDGEPSGGMTGDPAQSDSGPQDEDPANPDAGSDTEPADMPPAAGAGTCDAATPHGCYAPADGNHAMCPETAPVQSAFYPPIAEWAGCNGIMPTAAFGADPAARCTYLGPAGEVASCLCDSGAHWLCACNAPDLPGNGTWPACTAL